MPINDIEARRKASRDFHARREADGLKKVTLWLSPEARFKLDAMKKVAGSKDKAANAAILAWSGPEPAGTSQRLDEALREKFRPAEGPQVLDIPGVGRVSGVAGPFIQVGPIRPKYGERSKKPKPSK